MSFKPLLTALLVLMGGVCLTAQITLRGIITEEETSTPLKDAAVSINGKALFASTNETGEFVIANVPKGKQTLVVTHAGYLPLEQVFDLQLTVTGEANVNLSLRKDPVSNVLNANTGATATGDIPTVTLDEADSETEGASEVANLLHANRDVFQTISGFGWSTFRFRERGYDSENFPLYLNGVNVNDPETGGTFFGEFGGLNDVMRVKETTIGLEPAEFAFSELGGATQIDTRASVQRKQIRASYAVSNRSYRNRVMLTMNTGLMPGGWAVSASLGRRWAQEGWYEGTPFDGYSYFLSVDKKVKKHNFNITVLGAPTKRGRTGDTFQEMIDLAGTTRYNPNWGYWNGEKRNAQISHSHQPMAMLRWDWNPSAKTGLTVSAFGQAGVNGTTRLDWFNATNPSPDYNRRLPSSLDDSLATSQWAAAMRNDVNLRQIDWAGIWASNSSNQTNVYNANGIPENTVSGKQSSVILSDFREDSKEVSVNAVIRHQLSDRLTLNGGANYQYYVGQNFKIVDDLLGGDFHVDINPFAQRDLPNNPEALNNDLKYPNHVVKEGDKFGYDYDENLRKANVWAQVTANFRKFNFFAGGSLSQNQLWRNGHMQNGRFPNNSLGESAKATYNTYGIKAGTTYKFNGRNYLYANGFIGTRAPLFREIFLSPRTRNDFLETKPYGITSGEAGYLLRAPRFRARVTGYWTKFNNQVESLLLYGQVTNAFGTEIRTGVDQVNSGIEAAFEVKPFAQWVFSGATNLGYYRYTSRPELSFYEDNTSTITLDHVPVYVNNYLVPRTPQTAGSLAVKYEGKKFWFASLTANFVDDMWYEFDRARRTGDYAIQVAGSGVQQGSADWYKIFNQTKAPSAFTLDFFGGKSWRIKYKYFININAGVNNILNNTKIVQTGRESYFRAFKDANDQRLYQNEVLYAPGTNYFIGLTVRM